MENFTFEKLIERLKNNEIVGLKSIGGILSDDFKGFERNKLVKCKLLTDYYSAKIVGILFSVNCFGILSTTEIDSLTDYLHNY